MINDYLKTNEVPKDEFCSMLKIGLSKVMMGQDLLKICLAHAETNETLQTVFVNVINSEAFDKENDFFPLLKICREMNCHNMVTQLKNAITPRRALISFTIEDFSRFRQSMIGPTEDQIHVDK